MNNFDFITKNASECCLFLKKNEDFPISSPCKIACFGNGIRNIVKGGTGSGDVNCDKVIQVEEALEQLGFEVVNKDYLDAYDAAKKENYDNFIKAVKKEAKANHRLLIFESMGKVVPNFEFRYNLDYEADLAIYVLSRKSGEGSDRKYEAGDFYLTESEIYEINYLNKHYKKFMLVLNTGDVIDLSQVRNTKNILLLGLLGATTSKILVNILMGKSNPTGKLTSSYASIYPNITSFGDRDDTIYSEGVFVGYRYFDIDKKHLLFPFGFGLSYSKFEYKLIRITNVKSQFNIKVEVINKSNYPGKEVIQLYLSKPSGKIVQPIKELVGFYKTKELKENESEVIDLKFDLSDYPSFSEEDSSYVLESGDYYLLLGNSSENTETICKINLDGYVSIKKVKSLNIDYKEDYSKIIKKIKRDFDSENIKEFNLSIKDFRSSEVSYEFKTRINKDVLKLNNKELALLTNGRFNRSIGSMIGEESSQVSGAAGETTDRIYGVGQIVMSDGPAGLRLSPMYKETKKGKKRPLGVNNIYTDLVDFSGIIKPIIKKLAYRKPKKKDVVLYQETTPIPVASAISCSWNLDLARGFASIVKGEMEKYNVDMWLAPALNIKRSVLCGRNFEYFSEDPFISGMFSSAMVKGIEDNKHYAVIKHFACNNQETNRTRSNSVVSERVLRDIYLKGFEICIKDSNPKGLMTSYNLLNGIHTSDDKKLVKDILRCEFNYQGIVMTDWIFDYPFSDKNSKYSKPNFLDIVKTTTELIMPGNKKAVKQIQKEIRKNKEFKQQVIENVSRLVNLTKII